MYDQTPLNRIEAMTRKPYVEPGQQQDDRGVRQLIADITELVELQARLMLDDARMTMASLVRPILLMGVATVVALGTIPVFILASASLLVEEQQWSPRVAQFACAVAALLAAIGLASLALQKLRTTAEPLRRSWSEMEKNLDKLREMLVGREPIVERFEQRDGSK